MKPVIGWWYSYCCIEDLYPIETQEELDEVVTNLEDDEPGALLPRVWPTMAEALADPWMSGFQNASEPAKKRLGL